MSVKYGVGIDPGKFGAVAVMSVTEQSIVYVADTPIVKGKTAKLDRYDIQAMAEILRYIDECWLRRQKRDESIIVLEHAVSMPGQDSGTVMKAGYGYGLWEGMLAMLKLPYRVVYPITWTRALFQGLMGEGKQNSYDVAKANFPDAEFIPPGTRKRKPRDGRTDAMCMALYGVRFIAQE